MRWLVRSVLAVVVVVVLGVGALFAIPAEKIAAVVIGQFNALTGRELVIVGAVRPSIWPVLGVKTGAVSMSNAAWSDAGPMLQADGLAISIDMAALITGAIKITEIAATGARVVLERSAEGQENWVFGGDAGGEVSAATPGVGAAFALASGVISDGALVFVDHGTGTRVEIGQIAAKLAIPDYQGEALLDMTAVMNGQAFAAALTLGQFAPFLDGRVVPVDLKLRAGEAEVSFAGRAGRAPIAGEGALVADLGDMADVAALIGVADLGVPQGLGAKSVTVKGALTVTGAGSVHLRSAVVGLDDNQLSGDADLITAGERPKLSAQIRAGALDLAALAQGSGGDAGGGSGGGGAGAGWSEVPMDVSALGVWDMGVAVTAESVDLGMAKLGPSQVLVTVDRGRAVFDIRRIVAYQGSVSGQFVVNGRKGLSVGGDLTFADMALEPLLRDFGGYERLVGMGDFKLKFLGVGQSIAAIMQGLEGTGSLSLSKGEVRGLDIPGMLRTLDPGYVGEGRKTAFDKISASFTIAEGVLVNEDLSLQAPYITATGAGKVDLGRKRLDYRIKAVALADVSGAGGVTAPLLITGTWANPSFALDLEALAKERLDEEMAKLEQEAKAAADAAAEAAKLKLQEELGIVPLEGESIEDAARRRADEALAEAAAKALEGLVNGGN